MTKLAEEEFASVNLAPSQAFLLMTVNRQPGMHPGEIGKIMMLTPSTVTRLIEKMEQKGYVTRETKGKFTTVHPNEESLELHAKIKEAWRGLLARYEALIGKEESKKLTSDIFEAVEKLSE
ncbi:MarR family transcriptional regulator [bacterium]|nr:MarR family transcriptional regulator [bacterium]